jgi:hypothetical protein
VFSGMLASTLLAVSFVPVFYVVVEEFRSRGKPSPKPAAD